MNDTKIIFFKKIPSIDAYSEPFQECKIKISVRIDSN